MIAVGQKVLQKIPKCCCFLFFSAQPWHGVIWGGQKKEKRERESPSLIFRKGEREEGKASSYFAFLTFSRCVLFSRPAREGIIYTRFLRENGPSCVRRALVFDASPVFSLTKGQKSFCQSVNGYFRIAKTKKGAKRRAIIYLAQYVIRESRRQSFPLSPQSLSFPRCCYCAKKSFFPLSATLSILGRRRGRRGCRKKGTPHGKANCSPLFMKIATKGGWKPNTAQTDTVPSKTTRRRRSGRRSFFRGKFPPAFFCAGNAKLRFKKCGTAFLSRGRGASKRQKKRERDGSRKNYLAIDQVLLRKKRGGGGALPPPLPCFFVPPGQKGKELWLTASEGGGRRAKKVFQKTNG